MKKLPPSGYVSADEATQPGYLAKRMKLYRDQVKAEKKKADELKAELAAKVKPLKAKL